MTRKWVAGACALACALFVTAGYSPRQTKPAKPTTQNESGKEIATESFPPLAFPAAWPAPLAKPDGTPPVIAAALAKKVLSGGAEALPALERAALESGFSIHDQDGKILFTPAPEADNGMSILDLDLVVAAEGARRKSLVTYGDLQHELKENVEDLPLTSLFSTAIIEGINSKKTAEQVWGHFIMETGFQSEGAYDPIGTGDDTQVSVPQAIFLCYEAAGQAWAGTQAAPEAPRTDLSPDVPPAEEPPPGRPRGHGPLADTFQALARDAAFRDLRQTITSFSETAIAEYIRDHPQSTPHNSLLNLARQQILAVGTTINLKMTGAPLVRSSITGNSGGKRPLFVFVTFNVSEDVRKRYDAARKFMPSSQRLPDNGPQDLIVQLATDENVIVAKPGLVPTQGTQAETSLVGQVQRRELPPTPREDDYKTTLTALVPPKNPMVRRVFSVPIRDWLGNGLEVNVLITVQGSGQIRQDDERIYWAYDRKLVATTVLNYDFPSAAMTPELYKPTEPNRFTSYMKVQVDPKKPSPDPDPQYKIDDILIYEAPAVGCGVKEGEMARWVTKVESLPWKPKMQLPISNSRAQWDAKDKVYHFEVGFPDLPVRISSTLAGESFADYGILYDLFLPQDKTGNSLGANSLKLSKVQARGSANPMKLKIQRFEGFKGDTTATVKFEWFIQRVGGPGGSPPPTLSLEQQAVVDSNVKAAVEQWASQSLPTQLASQQTLRLPPLPRQHGPVWLSDPSAATCSAIEISDGLPPSAKAASH